MYIPGSSSKKKTGLSSLNEFPSLKDSQVNQLGKVSLSPLLPLGNGRKTREKSPLLFPQKSSFPTSSLQLKLSSRFSSYSLVSTHGSPNHPPAARLQSCPLKRSLPQPPFLPATLLLQPPFFSAICAP